MSMLRGLAITFLILNVMLWYLFHLLKLNGDIEFNPGQGLTLVKAFQFVT